MREVGDFGAVERFFAFCAGEEAGEDGAVPEDGFAEVGPGFEVIVGFLDLVKITEARGPTDGDGAINGGFGAFGNDVGGFFDGGDVGADEEAVYRFGAAAGDGEAGEALKVREVRRRERGFDGGECSAGRVIDLPGDVVNWNGLIGQVEVAADEVGIGLAVYEFDEEIDFTWVSAEDVIADLDDDSAGAVGGAVGTNGRVRIGIGGSGIEDVESFDRCAVGDRSIELKG